MTGREADWICLTFAPVLTWATANQESGFFPQATAHAPSAKRRLSYDLRSHLTELLGKSCRLRFQGNSQRAEYETMTKNTEQLLVIIDEFRRLAVGDELNISSSGESYSS